LRLNFLQDMARCIKEEKQFVFRQIADPHEVMAWKGATTTTGR